MSKRSGSLVTLGLEGLLVLRAGHGHWSVSGLRTSPPFFAGHATLAEQRTRGEIRCKVAKYHKLQLRNAQGSDSIGYASFDKGFSMVDDAKDQKKTVLDDIDYHLIDLLQKDSGQSGEELSKILASRGFEIKSAAINARIKKMIDSGFILKRTIQIDYRKFGAPQIHLLAVNVADKKTGSFEEFLNIVNSSPCLQARCPYQHSFFNGGPLA